MLTHFKIPVDIFDKTANLSPAATILYVYLHCLADIASSNRVCISLRDLSEQTNLEPRTLSRLKSQLVEAGLISIDRPFNRSLTDTITLL